MNGKNSSRFIPLLLIICVVTVGFILLGVRNSQLHDFYDAMKLRKMNVSAQKELGQLIVADLSKLSSRISSLIINKNPAQQEQLFDATMDAITDIHASLDLLTFGGKLVRTQQLNLPDQSKKHITIIYTPRDPDSYNLEVLTLRPLLIDLKQLVEQTTEITQERNRLLINKETASLHKESRKVSLFVKKLDAHILRMTETANKLRYDATNELHELDQLIERYKAKNIRIDRAWVTGIITSVMLLIGVIYLQILASRRTLETTLEQLLETDFKLQEINTEVQALNETLEVQVRDRTLELQRYEQIVSTDRDLICFLDRDFNFLAINRQFSEYLQIPMETIYGRHVREVLGEESFQRSEQQLYACLAGETCTFEQPREFPERGLRQVEILLTPYRNLDGEVEGVVARATDITEKAKQKANQQLSTKVFESTTEGIIITDPDANILAVNPAFTTITGYTEAEVLGKNPNLLKSGRQDSDFYQQLWETLINTGQWQGEIWNQRKNGEVFPQWLTINATYNDAKEVSNYVSVFTDISSTRKAMEALEHQAHHHPLTNLPNRLLMTARLKHSIQKAVRDRQQGAVFYLDLDNFKNVNDSLGHTAGDQLLLDVAKRLQGQVREVDTVAHISGDEFIVILDQIRSVQDATHCAAQILEKLQAPFNIQSYQLYLSASLGITIFPKDGTSVENLLKNSDAAMYKAKEAGKNRYHVYSHQLTEAALERVSLESYLRQALERKELILHYQPQVSLASGKIVAFEALIRWQHPQLGLIPPDKFIPLTEETGLIISIGEWVLRSACEQLLEWRRQGYDLVRIAVNLSGKQIQQKDLHLMVARVLEETGCPAESLELEITEGFIMQHPEQSIAVLKQIRALGVELSVDDFGTGHSSLNYLKKLPINRLKVDRSFISDIFTDPEDEAITKAIIALGHGLNLQITAEGIETEKQLSYLHDLGCNEGQGFLISRPLPTEQINLLLDPPNKKSSM